MVVVPAGTRNHFALDLGLDRNDVVGALDAYGEAFEQRHRPRRRQRARVREQRLARPVRGHRPVARVPRRQARDHARGAAGDARARTRSRSTCASPAPTATRTTGRTCSRCPTAPTGRPSPASPRGPASTRAGSASSPCSCPTASPRRASSPTSPPGRADRFEGYLSWDTPSLTVESGGPVAVGLDGEALEMDPPLVFTSRPGVLRIRRHAQAIGYSPAALSIAAEDAERRCAGAWRSAVR